MPIEREDVLHIAHLARLRLEGDEVGRYTDELSAIIEFVEQMNVIDTDGVTPMDHPLDMTQPLRPDTVTEPDRREEYQAHAPAMRDGLYLVPKVID